MTGRIIQHGPAPDVDWEYYPARQPKPDPAFSLQVGATEVSAADARFAVSTDEERERLDLTIWHPVFASVPDLVRKRIALLLVDAFLGEDAVETWIGGMDIVADEPDDLVDSPGLLRALHRLESNATGERWVVYKVNSRKGIPLVISINSALKPLSHLDKPERIDVRIEGRYLDGQRLPSDDEIATWSIWEEAVGAALPESVALGRVTGDGSRRITWNVANGNEAKSLILGRAEQLQSKISVTVQNDAGWSAFKRSFFIRRSVRGIVFRAFPWRVRIAVGNGLRPKPPTMNPERRARTHC